MREDSMQLLKDIKRYNVRKMGLLNPCDPIDKKIMMLMEKNELTVDYVEVK